MALGISAAGWVAIGTTAVGAIASNKQANAANRAANNAADATNRAADLSEQQYADWQKDFLPLQHHIAQRALKVGSQQEFDANAEKAAGDVTQAYGKAKTDLGQRLASYGVDPSSGKYATQFTRLGLAEAADAAGAQTKSRNDTRAYADQYQTAAYGLGKGIPGSAISGMNNAAGNSLALANYNAGAASRTASGWGNLGQTIFNAMKPGTSPGLDYGSMVNPPTAFGVPGYGTSPMTP